MRTEASAESIARAQHDPAAFAPIYQQYADRIFAFCLLHTGNRQQAEDLTADTFERALATIIRYENRGVPFSHWLLRIAANTLVAHIRHDGRAILVDDTCLHEGVAVGQWGMDPARLAERWERADQLMAHIAGLGSDQRRVIQLRFYEDRSIGEIATLMDRTLPATRQLLYRAIIALRHSVRAEEDGPNHVGSHRVGDG